MYVLGTHPGICVLNPVKYGKHFELSLPPSTFISPKKKNQWWFEEPQRLLQQFYAK